MSILSTVLKEFDNHMDLFKHVLHKSPYHLKYTKDSNRPNLLLIHSTELSDKTNDIVKECNGLIIDKGLNIISYGMDTLIDNVDIIPQDGDEIYESEDGTMVKLFYYSSNGSDNGEWILSTNKRIDASRVRWASDETFMELFNKHLMDNSDGNVDYNKFTEGLDKESTHVFIIVSPLSFHIIPYTQSKLLFLFKRHNKTFKECHKLDCSDYPFVSTPNSINTENAVSKIEGGVKVQDKRGLIISRNGVRYKVDYMWFKRAEYLRYNMPTLKLSYLACDYKERLEFKAHFGHDEFYDYIDSLITDTINFSFMVYRESYIRKMYKIPRDHPVFLITCKIHNVYKENNVPIRIHDVYMAMNTLPVYTLDMILTFFGKNGFSLENLKTCV
jgi:hypothetical protein